ncbi:C-type lectin domain family 4 member A-like isoform X2 [Anas acuta]|uniref:C-type lectin domain family 4 member A-like isoform X2 n=1 Tax=Anas acuta TaxID=28680 RepID=UPI0035C89E02
MEAEITYAEVKFKNASPTEEVEVPQKKQQQHEQHTQTCPPWLPWLISLLLLLVCVALVVVLLVTHVPQSCDKPAALQGNHTEWHCILAVHQGKDNQMPWDKSQQNCSGMGSQLVVINTKAEQDFLYKEIQMKYQQKGKDFYIGLRAQKVGQWRWADQTPYNESAAFWRSGEPSNDPNELCVVIHHKTENLQNWNDVPCTTHSSRICETAAATL